MSALKTLLDVSGIIGNQTSGLNFRIGDIVANDTYIKILGSGVKKGYVGINTVSPSYHLDINGDTNSINLSVTNLSEFLDVSINNILTYHTIKQDDIVIMDNQKNIKNLFSAQVADIELSSNVITSLESSDKLVIMGNVGVGDNPDDNFKFDVSGNIQVRNYLNTNHIESYTNNEIYIHSHVILDDGKNIGIGKTPNQNIQIDISGDISFNQGYIDTTYVNLIKGRDEGNIDISNNTRFIEKVSINKDIDDKYVLDVSGDSQFTDICCNTIKMNICNSVSAGSGQLFILSAGTDTEMRTGVHQFSFGGGLPSDWVNGNFVGCYLGFSYRIVNIVIMAPENIGTGQNEYGINGIQIGFFFQGYETRIDGQLKANDPTADTVEKFILDCSYNTEEIFYIINTPVNVNGQGPFLNTGVDGSGILIGTNLVKSDEILYMETFNVGMGGDPNVIDNPNNYKITQGVRLFLTCITEEPIYNI